MNFITGNTLRNLQSWSSYLQVIVRLEQRPDIQDLITEINNTRRILEYGKSIISTVGLKLKNVLIKLTLSLRSINS